MQPPVGFMNQLKQAQSLKHGPFPPPRNVPSGEVKSEHSLPRKDTDIVDIQNKLLNQNSVQPNQGVNTAMDKRASLKIKGFPFKSDASEGKGYKQDAVESSAPSSFVTVMPNSSSGPQSSINSEPVAPAPPPRRDRAGTGPEDPNIPSPVAFTEKSPSAPSKVPNGSIRHTTSSNPPNLKMAPRPPERRDYKMNTTDTDKRIFGKSVGPELEKRFSGISVTSQRSSSRPSSTEGQNVPAPPPRASDIPSTLSMNRSDFPVQNTNVNTNVPVAPPRAKRNVKRTVSSTSSESSSTEVDPRVDNSRRLSTSSSESDRVNSLNRVVNHDSYPEGGKTPPLARKPLLKPKPKPTLPPRPPEQKPEIAKTKPIVKPDLGQPLKVNELSNAVNLQQSLHKSINQTEVSPQTAKDNKQGDDSVFLSSNSDTTTHSVKTPEARNRLIKAKPLKELIQKKLRKERIDITEPPYTDEVCCYPFFFLFCSIS